MFYSPKKFYKLITAHGIQKTKSFTNKAMKSVLFYILTEILQLNRKRKQKIQIGFHYFVRRVSRFQETVVLFLPSLTNFEFCFVD